MTTINILMTTLRDRGGAQYGNEAVTYLQHALQCANLAQQNGEPDSLVAACLLHDIGHMMHGLGEDAAQQGIDDRHEYLAQRYLTPLFGSDVTEPVRLHVEAKRYLCAINKRYWDSLSAASKTSLELQGGTFSKSAAKRFIYQRYAPDAVKLRLWDDQAKVSDHNTPDLDHFLPVLQACQAAVVR
ncbi:MAG: phosphonate degradation HD-domain oxygenase [Elainellaceae cyanobacterium]